MTCKKTFTLTPFTLNVLRKLNHNNTDIENESRGVYIGKFQNILPRGDSECKNIDSSF